MSTLGPSDREQIDRIEKKLEDNSVVNIVSVLKSSLEYMEKNIDKLAKDVEKLSDSQVALRQDLAEIKVTQAELKGKIRIPTPWFSVASGISASVAAIVAVLSITHVI